MNWIKDNITIVTALCALIVWLGGIAIHAAIVQSEIEHGLSMAKSDREKMREDDSKIEKRVKVVEDGQASQRAQLVRIETRQTAIKETSVRIDRKLEKMDSKMDQLIKRGN